MIAQVIYRKIDKGLLAKVKKLRKLNLEIVFTKGDKNSIVIDSYKIWDEGDNNNVVDGVYEVRIYEKAKDFILGASS
ncbi:MAG: hypothetical protein RXQ22_01425 [Sulfolobus sp.]